MKKRIGIAVMCILSLSLMAGCQKKNNDVADTSSVNNTTNLYSATDDLERVVGVTGDELISDYDDSKEVGIFYFLWLGASSVDGPYDVSAVLEKNPNAAEEPISWLVAGGGETGTRHWWGESLFGYYRSMDEWVVERDVQMLTDAGIDFMAIDYSNATEYPEQLKVLLKALDKYYQQGFDVPQVTFITKANSGKVVNSLYETAYQAYPEYKHLWYCKDGKPLIVGNVDSEDLSEECKEYFTFKYAQWPREGYHDDAFPWMDFDLDGDGVQTAYNWSDGTSIMSVSVAQHKGTLAFSSSAFYGDDTNHTRNYHNGANDTNEDAYLYGYNFAEQFEYAISADPDIIFITGWNEWIATRQSTWKDINGEPMTDPVILVDCANIDNSRDIQPMKGGYGDNYYMQMVQYIREFKGCKTVNSNLNTAADMVKTTIGMNKSFSQWNDVPAFYLDYTGDINDRDCTGFGSLKYQDTTGRNDIYKMKMTNDEETLYCYVETVDDIVGMDEGNCMSLFLDIHNEEKGWYGYEYRTLLTSDGVQLETYTEDKWKAVGTLEYKLKGNQLQIAIPLKDLNCENGKDISLEFKWADNYQEKEGIWSFYLNGDAAPYGRMNYVYSTLEKAADVTAASSKVSTDKTASTDASKTVSTDAPKTETTTTQTVTDPTKISEYEIVGNWSDSRVWPDGNEDASVGPKKSYDGNMGSKWNPCATTGYANGPGIVYKLAGTCNLSNIICTFGNREYFFDVYVSADGESYTQIASITKGNMSSMYDELTCTVDANAAKGVQYIKLIFTGSNSSDNNQYVNLLEVALGRTETNE